MEPLVDESCRRRFEQARRSDAAVRIENYLPPVDAPSLLGTLEELVMIDMEFGWKRAPGAAPGEPLSGPLVETYIKRHPQLAERDLALRLLRHEYELRSACGAPPPLDEYRRRFPQWIATGRELVPGGSPGAPAAATLLQGAPSDVVLAEPAEDSAHLLINAAVAGESSGRYSLTRLHAEGGLGRIWVAHDGSLRRDVALKELKPRPAADAESWRRFLKEAQVTGQLEHPNIVPVYELSRSADKQPFYTMRLVKGKTLRAAIAEFHARRRAKQSDPLDLPRLLQAFLGVCHAVSYAHSRGVVHRDLKPDNIILGDFGEVLVLDWGLAKTRDASEASIGGPAAPPASPDTTVVEGTIQGQIVGTPAYMAPEQAGGRVDEIDERTDVFGLGAVLFEILTGKPPRTGKQARAVIDDAVRLPIPAARTIEPSSPPALEAVCAKAMAQHPGDRYSAAADLAGEVEHYLADEPTSAFREPLWQRVERFVRKHRVKCAVAAAAATLIGLSVVGGLFLWQEMQHRSRRQLQAAEAERARQVEAAEAERVRQVDAAEAERVRQVEAAEIERRERIRATAEVGKALAISYAQHDQFAAAADLLDKTLVQVPDEPAFADVRPDLVARNKLYRQVSEFYRLTYEAERLEFLEYDERADDTCTSALKIIGALDGDRWPERLPNERTVPDGLTKLQSDKLREDVFREFFLLCSIRSKYGLLDLTDTSFDGVFRETLLLIERAEQLRPTQSGRALKAYLAARLRFVNLPVREIGAEVRPTNPADLYYLGLIYFWFNNVQGDGITGILDKVRILTGMDLSNAGVKATETLREASRLNPNHYWTWFFYGWTCFQDRDFVAAQLVMNTCVALDETQPLGYSYRGLAQVMQAADLTDDAAKQSLLRTRGLEDCTRAVAMEPRNAHLYWLLSQAQYRAGQQREALATMMRAVDLEEPLEFWKGRRIYHDKVHALVDLLSVALQFVGEAEEANVDVEAVAAVAEATARLRGAVVVRAEDQKQLDEWIARGEAVLKKYEKRIADHPRTICLRADAAAKAGKHAEALRDYEAVLEKLPNYWNGIHGKARMHAALGDWSTALAAYDRALDKSGAEWHTIEAHRGRALALHHLGKHLESDAAFAAAAAIDRRVVDPRAK